MQLVRTRLGDHVHVNSANGNGSGRVVRHHLKFIERVMIGVELCITAVRTGPIEVQTVIAVNLLCLGAPVHLHGRLLVAVVACDVECADRRARHLGDRRPGVASARNLLQ